MVATLHFLVVKTAAVTTAQVGVLKGKQIMTQSCTGWGTERETNWGTERETKNETIKFVITLGLHRQDNGSYLHMGWGPERDVN